MISRYLLFLDALISGWFLLLISRSWLVKKDVLCFCSFLFLCSLGIFLFGRDSHFALRVAGCCYCATHASNVLQSSSAIFGGTRSRHSHWRCFTPFASPCKCPIVLFILARFLLAAGFGLILVTFHFSTYYYIVGAHFWRRYRRQGPAISTRIIRQKMCMAMTIIIWRYGKVGKLTLISVCQITFIISVINAQPNNWSRC